MDRKQGRKPLIKVNVIFCKLRRILLEPLGRNLLSKGRSAVAFNASSSVLIARILQRDWNEVFDTSSSSPRRRGSVSGILGMTCADLESGLGPDVYERCCDN